MWRNPRLWMAAALVAAAGLGGVLWPRSERARSASVGPPNVLLITLDTTRADRLGVYGYAAARTPTLDRLGASGVVFERAVTAASTTLPAHASLMTGRNPAAHGVRNNGVPLKASVPTLASAFNAAGYRTAAFVSAFVLDDRFGLARG
ncbi:MAG: sulfatase-like hydrolase/transferase, partial [Acidobacteriota bacterium]